jgi:nucleoside-diphosphate-sugar epimerase
MKILITGSTGFVGRNLVPKLLNNKHDILELTIEQELSEQLYVDRTHKYIVDDNQEELVNCIEHFNPEIVIHLASFLTSNDDFNTLCKLLNTNLYFFCRVLDAVKNTRLKLFVNTGTFAEYSKGDDNFDPAYLYSATKTASRSFLNYYSKVYDFKQTTVVPYTIYGGSDTQKKIIDIIVGSIDSSTPVDLSPGEQVLDFIHIDDVTDFYISLVNNLDILSQKSNFKLGTGKGHSLKQLTEIIEVVTNRKTNINWGGKPYRSADVMYAVADISNQLEVLDWRPKISIRTGVRTQLSRKIKS